MKINKKTESIKNSRELTLKQKGRALEAIFASVGDHVMGMVVVDIDGKITRANQGFEALTGWEEQAVIGKFLFDIIPREDEDRNKVPFKETILSKILSGKVLVSSVLAASAAASAEELPVFYYVRKDKSRFPASSIITPTVLDGEVAGAVEIFYDITKERELERIRMDFISLASHQLRTPLSGTKWLIETMYRGILGKITKKQKEYLDDIYKINEQMIKLVSDTLNTLRLESEKTLIKIEKISVPSLFKDVLIMIAAAAKERNIALQSPLDHRTLTLETDPEILKAILGCFASNAVDYSKSGQKVVFNVKEESSEVVFFVRDFGIGIPKKEQKRIFERFYRASNAKIMKPSGTGLGLNIARALTEKINAKLSFESNENKGSTFYLRIPKRVENGCENKNNQE